MKLIVEDNSIQCGEHHYRCAVGKAGIGIKQGEGDNITPVGTFPLRQCWYRSDRLNTPPQTGLVIRQITREDGWCDAPEHPSYNQHVLLPFPDSHERLWRDDTRYDIIVPLGYNDDPITPGLGSAIFFHLASDDYQPTEGCVAVSLADMLAILPFCDENTMMEIR